MAAPSRAACAEAGDTTSFRGRADYERVKVSRNRGERWFCSESEAQEAGFKPSEQS